MEIRDEGDLKPREPAAGGSPARLFAAMLWRLGILLAATGTIAPLLAKTHRFFDHASCFRPQMLALALVCTPGALLVRKWRRVWLLVAVATVIWNGFEITPWYVPSDSSAGGQDFRACLANVHSRNPRRDAFVELVRGLRPALLVVEEVNRGWMRELEGLKDLLPAALADPREDDFGIALFSRFPIRDPQVVRFGPSEIPVLIATVSPEDRPITVIGAHTLPPSSAEGFERRNDELRALAERVSEHAGPLLLLGDLNVSPWSPFYRDFVKRTGLANTRKGFGLLSTWPAMLPKPLGIPIDHILHSGDFVTLACRLGPPIGSDHTPIVADLGFRAHAGRPKTTWPEPGSPRDEASVAVMEEGGSTGLTGRR